MYFIVGAGEGVVTHDFGKELYGDAGTKLLIGGQALAPGKSHGTCTAVWR